MELLWQNYQENNKYRLTSAFNSFYSEVEGFKDGYWEINPLLNYHGIYESNKLSDEETYHNQKKNYSPSFYIPLENISLHFLANLELTSGIRTFLIEEKLIKEEINLGYYGSDVADDFSKLELNEQVTIVSLLRVKIELDNRKSFFERAIKLFYGNAEILFYDHKILLFLPLEESKLNNIKLRIIKNLFLDFTVDLEVFWQGHVGIIGDLPTMKIDEMIIY